MAVEAVLTVSRNKYATVFLAFERELEFVLKSFLHHRNLSNRLFALLNSYQLKLSKSCFMLQLVNIGDRLVQIKKYSLALTHGFGRYLLLLDAPGDDFTDAILNDQNEEQLSLNLRALLGDSLCRYYIALSKDKSFQLPSTRALVIIHLQNVVKYMQAALRYENLYWLVYNCVTFSYTLIRLLLSVNLPEKCIESLLWCCVSMESSVPLMTVKYLPLRVTLYTAMSAVYYAISQPLQAELFTRRALDKIHQIAQIEHLTSQQTSPSVFIEATLKLGIYIFKRSVLETHKKTKSVLRPKVRPTIRDVLQSPWPRSPTEKLLDEMFTGRSAQFLAILESLSTYGARPFERHPPQPITEVDDDTITDVYQELFTAGTELALTYFYRIDKEANESSESLIKLSIEGSDIIPLSCIAQFIYRCYQLDCLEVFTILGPKAIDENVSSIRVLSVIEDMRKSDDKKAWEKAVSLLNILYSQDMAATLDDDIILDSSILVWNKIHEMYSDVVSYNSHDCKSILDSSKFNTLLEVIKKMLFVFTNIKMYLIDPLMYGDVALKYIYLLEAQADNKPGGPLCMSYDRSKLLYSLEVTEECMENVSSARDERFSCDDHLIVALHTEIVNTFWRLKVKLSATIPPQVPVESSLKVSSLLHKVKERTKKLEEWKEITAQITSSDVSVSSADELRDECGSDHLQYALLLTNLATITNNLQLLEEAFHHLKSYTCYNYTVRSSSNSTSVPPPPVLIQQSSTSLSFKPAEFHSDRVVSYYSLFGRIAESSNAKVRSSDHHFNELGMEVLAADDSILTVSGLQPNTMYVFAVAAYDDSGNMIGDSIGDSTKPILSSYNYSLPLCWSYLCQSAYKLGGFSIAGQATSLFWQKFIKPLNIEDTTGARLQSNDAECSSLSAKPEQFLYAVITTVFIQIHSIVKEQQLLPATHSLSVNSESIRLSLVHKTMTILKISGWINNHSLCLQSVIMCYLLLVPLMQVNNKTIADFLLKCHCVLQELPDHTLVGHHQAISSIHHMIAAISYYIGKVWLSFGKKSFLSNLFNSTRSLLLITLPSTDHHQEQQVSLSATLHDSSMGSMESNGQASVMSYTTQSSMVWDKGNSNQLKKKKKKKTLALGNEIPIDIKSPQFKTIEGFFISVLGLPNNEDIDFNGQEDPVVLHAAISSLPIQSAYREVMKFKRRPQYLEYFVHLCDLVMKQGKIDLILSWSSDLFAWLAKRNEILLSVKGYTFKRQVTPPLQRSNQIKGDSRRSTATAKHSNTSRSSQKSIVSRPTSVKKTEMSLAVVRRRITRDDVRYKAVSTLHTLLPNFWRASKCKRRLRVACMEEHSWRSQINIIIASCTLKCIVDDLKAKLPANVWLSVDWYRLDVAGEFIDDAIPSYHPKSDDMKEGSFSAKNLKNLNQLFLCYQRAVVLAYRGSCWNLLINACNGLWNSLAVLRYSIETSNPVGVAQLYGLSLRALYIASIHLLELCSINKTFSNLLTSNLKQMASLAVQVCYVNNHWEKTIYLSKMLIGNTGIYSMLYPVVVLSQEKLAKRVQQYSATPREPLEPSVHLDIQSHSFCDTIGISLGTTNVSFDLPPPSEHDKNDNDDMLGDALLALSRKLMARYLMKEFDCSESVTISCTGHAEHISDTYKKAIGSLMKEKKTKLTANGMHELGNVLYFIGEIRSASYWWRKGIKKLMKCKTFLSQWRSHLSSGIPASGYLMSAILASKIARYTLCHDIGTQFDYIHMSAFLFKNFLQHFTQQIRDIDFATYSISAESGILSAVCSDFFTLNSSLLISSLQFISHKMVFRGYSLQVLPILCLYEYFALTVARSIHHVILSRSYKVQVLSQLSLYSKAFKILQDLMNCVNLPLVSSYYNFSHSVSTNLQFQDNLPLNNSVNCKVLSAVIDNQHSSALRSLYSNISYAEFLLAKAATLTRLASTIEIIPHHKKSSSYPQRQQRKITPEMSLIDTKYTLLDVARVLVQEVMQLEQEICNKEFLPLKLRCHSMLSDIYCSFHCSEIATQISLLSLRAIQTSTAGEAKNNMSLQILLETQVALFKSLSLTKRSDVDADFPDPTDMIDKLEAYNDVELSCQLLYAYACRLYNIQSSSFDKIIDICKECITRLNKCDVLSQNGQRLKVDVTLLLSQILQTSDEVNCTNMRSIYEGLREMLKSQLKDCLGTSSLHDNCYVPQLHLLAIVNLQIICTHIQEHASYMDHSNENIKEAYDIINSITTTTLSGKYLKSELAIILCQLKNHGLNTQSYLLDALSTTLMFDYIQIFKMYWLLADMLMQEQSLQLENTKSSSDITNVSCSNSPSSKRTPTQQKRELIKSQAKQKYFIWTSIKAASHCQLIIEKFKQLTSEFHNEEITKFIPNELIQKLPLFALMHFNKESMSSSSSSLHEYSIEEIHKNMSNCNISWFSLLEYFKHLLELSFVPESLCKTSNQLHCHHFTPSIVPKVQSLFAFIEKYCPNFKTLCCVPNFLPILRPQSSTSSPLNETDLISPMSAKDGEVTILWCKDHTGNLKGFIALNDKHIKPSAIQPHSSTSGIYVYTFTTSSASALQLHHAWNDLANQCTAYVTSQITRPLSRSPSRMRQRTIEVAKQPIPFDLTKNIENAMVLLRDTLQVTHQVAVQVEPRTASSIAILLMPGGVSKTDKSDVYHFFKNLCFQHQKE